MELIAHLVDHNGVKKTHGLKAHCFQTAEYAKESIGNIPIKNTVYLAGLLHDMGKGKREYIEYIEASYRGEKVKKGSINHSFAGCIWILDHFHQDSSSVWERITAEVIGYAIGAHHGLFDCVDLQGNNGFLYRQQKSREEICYNETINNFFSEIAVETTLMEYFDKAVQEIKSFYGTVLKRYGNNHKSEILAQIGMLTRLVLSAVIYGDRRDTSEFMLQATIKQNRNTELSWEERRRYFEKKLAKFQEDSKLNQVRSNISRQCAEFAKRPAGIYRLSVPTGGGKTLASLYYSLCHGEIHLKKRIIFIIPLLSVLDQNAKVIKDYLPDQNEVLEHHSNIVNERQGGEDLDYLEFAAESWNYPVIVSTMVQLLNILFKHQTTAVGRMQALCDSVIVIDEVQMLPKRMTVMFNRAMNFLCEVCNATVILSSATQPCFEELKWPLHLAEKPDMVYLNAQQRQVFKRAHIINKTDSYGMDLETCKSFCHSLLEKCASLLIICNTKNETKALFEKMQYDLENMDCDIFHLSTSMCQKHRIDILNEIQARLNELQKCLQAKKYARKVVCVATPLAETGIEFSFENVVRVLAGVDNLAQAAGRCNRSNEYGHLGNVYLIHLKNENLKMLPDIVDAQNSTRKVLEVFRGEEETSLIDEAPVRKFYQNLYEETRNKAEYPVKIYGDSYYLARLLAVGSACGNRKNGKFLLQQPFRTVGEEFKVFEQNTTDVLVPYEEGEILINRLKEIALPQMHLTEIKEILRQARLYTVSIYEWQKQKLEQAGVLLNVLDGTVFVLDGKAYDGKFGLRIDVSALPQE